MRVRCDFHRSTIAIENAFIDYTVFITRISNFVPRRTRIAVAIENAFIDYTVFISLSQGHRTRIAVAIVN